MAFVSSCDLHTRGAGSRAFGASSDRIRTVWESSVAYGDLQPYPKIGGGSGGAPDARGRALEQVDDRRMSTNGEHGPATFPRLACRQLQGGPGSRSVPVSLLGRVAISKEPR
jgi:hypothetical protein